MRKAPLVPVALAMIAGIVVARHIAIATTTWLWCLAGCATATGITLLISKRLHAVSLVLTVLFCGLVGGLLSTIKLQHDWTRGCPEKAFLEVRLTETPMPREKSWRAKATVLSGGDITVDCGTKNSFLLLSVENPAPAGSDPSQTSKKDRKNHGLGLKNVKQVLKNCNGHLTLTQENGRFIADARMELAAETQT